MTYFQGIMLPMPNASPFKFLDSLFQAGRLPAPPAWLVEEGQRRCVLLINHVLMQEPQAMQRLARQKGRVVRALWGANAFTLQITPAGLFDLCEAPAALDLTLILSEASPLRLAEYALRGEKPPVRIDGDVQLAADINWLVDNVRWDLEEDLAKVFGDAPAHWLAQSVSGALSALRNFLGARVPAAAIAPGGRAGSSAGGPDAAAGSAV